MVTTVFGAVLWGKPAPTGRLAVTLVERRTKALLVEDDPNIVDLVRSNLTVRGYDTCLSPDGSRALQLLETERPDIVLLGPDVPRC